MSEKIEVRVPDIGDYGQVPVIEVLVATGDSVRKEQSLITLESDKATMEIPAPLDGRIESVEVKVGDQVAEGSLIVMIASEAAAVTASHEPEPETEKSTELEEAKDSAVNEQPTSPVDATAEGQEDHEAGETGNDYEFDVMVLGSGPGGYTAAFRAADLGLRVALVERYPVIGGVCLNVGCIPSKALLHTAQVIEEAAAMADNGVTFGSPDIDLDKLRSFKEGVVNRLTGGLAGMAKQRNVTVIEGQGTFTGTNEISVRSRAGESSEKTRSVSFAKAIIAVGSQSFELPGLPWDDPRVMDSTAALALDDIPDRLLVIGGGIIGLEMASVYHALGSVVTIVEMTAQLMPGTDIDLVRVLQKRIKKQYKAIHLKTKVTGMEVRDSGLIAQFEGDKAPAQEEFDRVLVAVGRVPNGKTISADKAGIDVDERGFISVDQQCRTNVATIFAIGDVTGQPMLAHRASHQAKVAAEVCAGKKRFFDARVIPSVAYTDPEIAWVGVTDTQAREAGLDFGVGKFPWAASGRALGINRPDGFTKLLFDNKTRRIIGAGIAGLNAGELIAECTLAIEMGCEVEDMALTIHPHPTLSESIGMAAEVYEGTITDLYIPHK